MESLKICNHKIWTIEGDTFKCVICDQISISLEDEMKISFENSQKKIERLNLENVRLRNIINPEKVLWLKCDICGNEENSYSLHLLKAHEKIDELEEKLKISKDKLKNISLYPIEPISNWTKAEYIREISYLKNELKQLKSVNKSIPLIENPYSLVCPKCKEKKLIRNWDKNKGAYLEQCKNKKCNYIHFEPE